MLGVAFPLKEHGAGAPSPTSICCAIAMHELLPIFQGTLKYTGDAAHIMFLSQIVQRSGLGANEYEGWLRITFSIIDGLADQEKDKMFAETVSRTSDAIESCLVEILTIKRDNNRIRSLQSIIMSALHLSCKFYAQRASYDFSLPSSRLEGGVRFDHTRMQDEYGQESPEDNGQLVHVAFSPLVIKHGDARGENVSQPMLLCLMAFLH